MGYFLFVRWSSVAFGPLSFCMIGLVVTLELVGIHLGLIDETYASYKRQPITSLYYQVRITSLHSKINDITCCEEAVCE